MSQKLLPAALMVMAVVGFSLFPPAAKAEGDGCDFCDPEVVQELAQARQQAEQVDNCEDVQYLDDKFNFAQASNDSNGQIDGASGPKRQGQYQYPIQPCGGGAGGGGGGVGAFNNVQPVPDNVKVIQGTFGSPSSKSVKYFIQTSAQGVMACAIQSADGSNVSLKNNATYTPNFDEAQLIPATFSTGVTERSQKANPLRQLADFSMQGLQGMLGMLGIAGGGQQGMMMGPICNYNKDPAACNQAMGQTANAASQGLNALAQNYQRNNLNGQGMIQPGPKTANITQPPSKQNQPNNSSKCDAQGAQDGHC